MNEISIPGKVILSGEYVVLFGGTAIALPAPRELKVRPAPHHPPLGYPAAAAAAFAVEVPELKKLEARPPVIPPCQFDTSELRGRDQFGQEIKLGLGSSAAEAVAALAWRYQACGLDWQEHRLEIASHARAAHLNLQHGLGSGIDVLVSAYGEALALQLVPGRRSIRQVQPVPLGQCPPLALVHTGVAANTRSLVSQFLMWQARAGKAGEQLLKAACQAADELAVAWNSGDWPLLRDALDTFDAKLRLCVDSASVAYLPARQYHFNEWARRYGGRAKPTGAGGGDMALLIGELPYHELEAEIIRLN